MTKSKSWDDYPPVLSTKEAGELLGIRRLTTISRLCKDGQFPATQIGDRGPWRIHRDELRMLFFARFKHRSLTNQLGEIELALSTLATIHRDKPVAETIREAHVIALNAYNQAREDEQQ